MACGGHSGRRPPAGVRRGVPRSFRPYPRIRWHRGWRRGIGARDRPSASSRLIAATWRSAMWTVGAASSCGCRPHRRAPRMADLAASKGPAETGSGGRGPVGVLLRRGGRRSRSPCSRLGLPIPTGATNAELLQSAGQHIDDYIAFACQLHRDLGALARTPQAHRYVTAAPPSLIRWNLLWLMMIVITPFATRILTESGGFQVRFTFYALVQVLTAGFLLLSVLGHGAPATARSSGSARHRAGRGRRAWSVVRARSWCRYRWPSSRRGRFACWAAGPLLQTDRLAAPAAQCPQSTLSSSRSRYDRMSMPSSACLHTASPRLLASGAATSRRRRAQPYCVSRRRRGRPPPASRRARPRRPRHGR
jgi:hypothetical protein